MLERFALIKDFLEKIQKLEELAENVNES